MTTGSEWLIDAYGCTPSLLAELFAVQQVCEHVIGELNLFVVGTPQWHQFPPPSGVTGMYLLSESHLTCHTFPEYGLATFNLYCCRPRSGWSWEEGLAGMLGANRVVVRHWERGADESRPQNSRSQESGHLPRGGGELVEAAAVKGNEMDGGPTT